MPLTDKPPRVLTRFGRTTPYWIYDMCLVSVSQRKARHTTRKKFGGKTPRNNRASEILC